MQNAQKAEPRSTVATAIPGDTSGGSPRPLTCTRGTAVPYGWKPHTGAPGIFASVKNDRGVPFWDEFELAFPRQAERAPMVEWYEARPTTNVLSYEERPDLLVLSYRGRKVFYVVDFRGSLLHSIALVGLSLFGQPGHSGEQDIHELARAYCARRGEVFVHVPNADLVRLSANTPSTGAA